MTPMDGSQRTESRTTDWLVRLAALPIASAIGVALYVQSGTTAWFAATAAVVAYLLMLAVNRLVRRTRRIEQLQHEVATLQSAMDRMGSKVANDIEPALPMAPQLSANPSQSDAAPEFGRRRSAVATEPRAAPHVNPMSHRPGRPQESFEGIMPWPEMPPEAPAAQTAGQTTAPAPQLAAQQSTAAPPRKTAAEPNSPKNYERLQHLVKQLASEVGGPKATSPDPDRRATSNTKQQPAASPPAPQMTPPRNRVSTSNQSPDVARVLEAIEAERVDVYLDPIQALENRKPRHFEVAVRFRDESGQPISADVMDPIVRAAGLGPRIDIVKLPRAARVAERVQQRGRPSDVLAALTGDSLADQTFLSQINNALGAAPPAGMVLSFTQADVRRFGRLHWETLATLSDMGLRFAIEHVTDLDMDFEALKARHFDFVKLDATVFLDGMPAVGGYVSARDICRHFSHIGLALIVGRIADERVLAEILGFGVLLGQGTLFGAPRPVRQDVLARTQAA